MSTFALDRRGTGRRGDTNMGLAFRLAVGVHSAEATARFGAVLGAAKLAAKNSVAVRAAVLPGD
jgi:hypothetical protein